MQAVGIEPTPGAAVTISGETARAPVSGSGRFRLNLDPGDYTVTVVSGFGTRTASRCRPAGATLTSP
jgi:hypothetical protein